MAELVLAHTLNMEPKPGGSTEVAPGPEASLGPTFDKISAAFNDPLLDVFPLPHEADNYQAAATVEDASFLIFTMAKGNKSGTFSILQADTVHGSLPKELASRFLLDDSFRLSPNRVMIGGTRAHHSKTVYFFARFEVGVTENRKVEVEQMVSRFYCRHIPKKKKGDKGKSAMGALELTVAEFPELVRPHFSYVGRAIGRPAFSREDYKETRLVLLASLHRDGLIDDNGDEQAGGGDQDGGDRSDEDQAADEQEFVYRVEAAPPTQAIPSMYGQAPPPAPFVVLQTGSGDDDIDGEENIEYEVDPVDGKLTVTNTNETRYSVYVKERPGGRTRGDKEKESSSQHQGIIIPHYNCFKSVEMNIFLPLSCMQDLRPTPELARVRPAEEQRPLLGLAELGLQETMRMTTTTTVASAAGAPVRGPRPRPLPAGGRLLLGPRTRKRAGERHLLLRRTRLKMLVRKRSQWTKDTLSRR